MTEPQSPRALLVTGGAGFIGANFIHSFMAANPGCRVVNLDLLTYAGNLENLKGIEGNPSYRFVRGDIGDAALVADLLREESIDAVVHFAAESHVDRSISGPEIFIRTNVLGTQVLLEESRKHWQTGVRPGFRYLQVSTDEVYGSLGATGFFTEETPLAANSPYSASKAGADLLVRAYHETYGMPTLTTRCSNNYGPYQFPEKLIPLIILNAVRGKPLPIYGDGLNVRDWLYVGDHCEAIRAVLARGRSGETYNIGGCNEKTNLEVVNTVCAILDELLPDSPSRPHASLITFVKDRLGHDRRYAIDAGKIGRELGWRPKESFETGIRKTVQWYLDHMAWVEQVASGEYRNWVEANYSER